jgi:glycosyltransferase involved in cell wall biosynthesis
VNTGILGPFPPFRGGIATFNTHLAHHLEPCRPTIALNYCQQYPRLIFPGKTQFDESEQPFAVDSSPLFAPFRPWRWPDARRRLKAQNISLLILSWWTPIFAPSMYSFLKGYRNFSNTRFLAICHNVMPHERIPFSLFFQKRLFGLMDSFITHNNEDAATLREWFPNSSVKSLFHPLYDRFPSLPGLDRQQAQEKLGIPPDRRPVILFFGLVRPYKGLATLLKAMELMHAASESAPFLVIAGEFYERNHVYEPALSNLRNAGCLLLHDHFIPNESVHLYFTAADTVVLPYRHATQSGIIPLAYATGRGVVTTRVGGLPEMVDDGISGIIVPPEDPAALAQGIRSYLDRQPDFERQIPETARRFSWEHYVRQLLELS